ncbi:UDP-glycosyltransferase 13-like [Trifolium pratense]|uniref:UDP-glycosyltransferase 13-like n=1 Tax=Trifolium pratense TaxID=57577 RepID=UPI001E6913AA|nr:UDP-glycosyltransferase 13-like [Trifolium pratense]
MDTIILYPVMGRGHLVPMVELGKFITTHHHDTLSVKIFLPSSSNTTNSQYITTLIAATPSITFHQLSRSQNLTTSLQSFISQSSKPKAFILDFFNHSAVAITTVLNIPTFYYFPNAASTVALFLYTPTIYHNTSNKKTSIYNDALRNIPGLPPLSPEDMPEPMVDRRSQSYKSFMNMSIQMRKTDGLIVNSFEMLETKAFMALKNGACVMEEQKPRVFCVGPLVETVKENNDVVDDDDHDGCFSWLNLQPSQSVVLLSFGSYGRFSKSQIIEIAIGLEKSEKRFLWVVRNPIGYERKELSFEELLPKGFLERTKEKGKVLRDWAPQVKILSHDSVGGFVTHCGWNSVLEAINCGVSMIAWPLYAEQRLNRVVMVEEMKVALALKQNEDGFVKASELEKRVREIMDTDRGRGKKVKERVLGAKNDAISALSDGGSSRFDLNKLVELWRQ